MRRTITVSGRSFTFADLRDLMAKASAPRSGDELAGVAAGTALERAAARMLLADVDLRTLLAEELIPAADDDVTRLILDSHDERAFAPVSAMTVGEFRDHLLSDGADAAALAALAAGITPEMAAAVSKLMRNQDLVAVAAKVEVVTGLRNTLGLRGRLSSRIQPNHPTDDPRGIAAAIVDGLAMGCGDACIGINPAADTVDGTVDLLVVLDRAISALRIPTQSCVLTHVTNTLAALERGAPVDLVFQSVAGTEGANRAFGIDMVMLAEARQAALELGRGTVGANVMYFETGQGSCLSAGAAHGVDQQTLEARAYGVARVFEPLLVNTVVGFIGPEYLYDGKQIRRAGLEDHFCGKLLGLPMGADVCYTNHAEADQDDSDDLLTLLAVAGCTYFMGVPGADDVMLEYQSTSYHDIAATQQLLGRRPAPEFDEWLRTQGIVDEDGRLAQIRADHPLLELAR